MGRGKDCFITNISSCIPTEMSRLIEVLLASIRRSSCFSVPSSQFPVPSSQFPVFRSELTRFSRLAVLLLTLAVFVAAPSPSSAEEVRFRVDADSTFGFVVDEFGTTVAVGDLLDGSGPMLVAGAPGTVSNVWIDPPLPEADGGGVFGLHSSSFAGAFNDTIALWSQSFHRMHLGQSVVFVSNYYQINGTGIPILVVGDPAAQNGLGAFHFYQDGGSGVIETIVDVPRPPSDSGAANVSYATGHSLARCDFNGDGFDDIIVGSDAAVLGEVGRVLIYFGGVGADTEPDYAIHCTDSYSSFGKFISGAGDLDGDGNEDLVVGDGFTGKTYVIFGRPGGQKLATSYPPIITVTDFGTDYNGITLQTDQCGAVAGGFKITSDSYSGLNIVVSERTGGYRAVNVYNGPYYAGATLAVVSSIVGETTFGDRLAMGGDVNGDGVADLLVGAHHLNPRGTGTNTGMVGLFLGGTLPAFLNVAADQYTSTPDRWFISPEDLADFSAFGSAVTFMADPDGGLMDQIVAGAPAGSPSIEHGRVYGIDPASSDKISLTNLSSVVPSYSAGTNVTYSVTATHVDGKPLKVTMDAPDFGLADQELTDTGGGVYSCTVPGVDLTPGSYPVEFFAVSSWDGTVDGDGAFVLVKASIEVIYNNVKYVTPADPQGETNLQYDGTPYSSVVWDFDGDGMKDLFVSITDYQSMLYKGTSVSQVGIAAFVPQPASTFVGGSPQAGLRGVSVGDLDNTDGKTDLFAAHATDCRLYRWDGTNIVNLAPATGLDTFSEVVTGTWGDLDGDGHDDLFLARAEAYTEDPPNYGAAKVSPASVIVTNTDDGAGGRIFVRTPAGLPDNLYSTNAAWGDYDEDGDPDLFVGAVWSMGAGGSKLYRNDGGTFSDQTLSQLGSTAITGVVGCAWNDMNSDGRLDLVLVRYGGQILIFYKSAGDGFDDGLGGSAPQAFGPAHGFSGMAIYDYNNDGYNDILGLSSDDTRPSLLFQNVWEAGLGFFELPGTIGLTATGYTHGAVATDFGGAGGTPDGLADLYLGRPTASDAFYYKSEARPPLGALDAHYTAVRLEGATGSTNIIGIGATVLVQAGGLSQIKQVDGGSLRGSQSDRDLVFGLGSNPGPVTATIKWPDGLVQTDVPLLIDQLNTITNSPILVQDTSVTGTYVVKATGLVDWVFTWEVDGPSDPAVDAVLFDLGSIPLQCRPGYSVITDATPGVTLSYTANATGGYTHVMTWLDRTCVPKCTIPFQVESGMAGQIDTSSTTSLRIRICIGS